MTERPSPYLCGKLPCSVCRHPIKKPSVDFAFSVHALSALRFSHQFGKNHFPRHQREYGSAYLRVSHALRQRSDALEVQQLDSKSPEGPHPECKSQSFHIGSPLILTWVKLPERSARYA
jgi:hypothetical protein